MGTFLQITIGYGWITRMSEWGQAIRDRDQICQIGKALRYSTLMSECQGEFEAHHLIGRGNKHLRNNPDNGIELCSFHHKYCPKFSPHANKKGFERFLKKYYPERWKFLQKHKHEINKGSEFKEIHEADKQGVINE